MHMSGTGYRAFPRNIRLLIVSRFVRSVGQGVTVASFALYLAIVIFYMIPRGADAD